MTRMLDDTRREIYETKKRVKKKQYKQMKRTWDLISPHLENTRREVLRTFKNNPEINHITFIRDGRVQMGFNIDEKKEKK